MDIDVYIFRVNLDEEDCSRMTRKHSITISLCYTLFDCGTVDIPAVDKKYLTAFIALRTARIRYKAMGIFPLYFDQFSVSRINRLYGSEFIAISRSRYYCLLVVNESKSYVRIVYSQLLYHIYDYSSFSSIALHEFASGRSVVKYIFDNHSGSRIHTCLLGTYGITSLHFELCSHLISLCLGIDCEPGYRCNAGKSFPPEA